MKITFENDSGIIDLNGGVWRIKEIEGLGFLPKTVKVIRYNGIDGQELLASVTHSRDITISGDIIRRDKVSGELSRAIHILDKPGFLKIRIGTKMRKIKARASVFSADTKDRNNVYQSFVMQLTCDYPYFEDFSATRLSLFTRKDLIKDKFTLPCVFTKRTSRINVINSGDVVSRPVVYLVCKTEPQSDDYAIELLNHTKNQYFKLDYKMAKGEEICIDFEKRTVTSLKGEEETNLIGYISDDTFMSEFFLDTGTNDLECLIYGDGAEITAVCEYSAKYKEAVI